MVAGGTGGTGGKDKPPRVTGGPIGPDGKPKRSPPPARNSAPSQPAIVGTAAGSSCGTGVTIRFKAVVGDQDFACGQSYAAQGSTNTTVTPQDFRFFVQDVALIRSDGKRVPVRLKVRPPWQAKTVALLDFEDKKPPCAGNTELNTELTGDIPSGTYTGLTFVNGVPEDLNHVDPVMLPDPLLSYRDLFWDTQRGFRFVKAELDQLDPGSGNGVFQLGSSDCAGDPLRCAKPNRNLVEIDDFNVCSDVVLADIGEIFAYNNLGQPTACTPSGEYCVPMFDAIGVEYDTGEPQEGQTVFRKQ